MIAKAGLGLIGISAISVGGVALTKPHLLGMDYMPEWHSLSEDNGYSDTNYGTGKFGKKYGKYLVGVTHKGTATNKTNKSWWEWAYRRLSKDKDNSKSKKFKKEEHIAGGFITTGDNAGKSLHKVCEDAYKKNDNDIKGNDGSDTDFKKDEVWKYCSPGKLTTTSEDKYTTTQIGGEEENKKILISVKDNSNDWFWEKRDKDFWETSGDWSGSGAAGSDGNKSIFKTAYDNKDSSETPRKTIKKLCEEAYKLTKNEKDNDNKDAKKFCKLEA